MHVLILASYSPSLINFRGPLILDLIAAGHEISVAAPDMSRSIRCELRAIGVEAHDVHVQRTGQNVISDIKYFVCLKRLIGSSQPDRVLTYTIKPNIWGAFAAASHNIASYAMVTGLGYLFMDKCVEDSLKTKMMNLLVRWIYRRATNHNRRVIFQNRDDLDEFIAAGCLADRRKSVLVNGSGVCLEKYSKASLPEEPSFLMVARLLRAKGVREYCLAAKIIKAIHPEVRLQLVGYFDEGPDAVDRQDFESLIVDGVEYLGLLDDVRPAITDCTVYVLPSYREGTPRTVLEAMAMGRPIITTDAPGCRETVIDGENGFLVPTRSVDDLVAAMQKFIDDPALAQTMGQRSREIAEEKYDVHKVNAVMLREMGIT